MPGTQDTVTNNTYIQSLQSQSDSIGLVSTGKSLAIISAATNLDSTAVERLQQSGVLVLRSSTEAISRSLESKEFVNAITWAVSEGGVATLILVGHSQAASIPMGQPGQPFDIAQRARIHNERVEASKLKLKDDYARCCSFPAVCDLLATGQLSIHALFYLQERGAFLKLDNEHEEFVLPG